MTRLLYGLIGLTIWYLQFDVTWGYKENILMFITDDMRADINYGYYNPNDPIDVTLKQRVHTPNLDSLANESAIFTHAYAQYPVCGPSRASILTGRRPENIGSFDNHHKIRQRCNRITSLVRDLKANGYKTVSIGKSFHHHHTNAMPFDPPSWSKIYPSEPDDLPGERESCGYVSSDKSPRELLVDEKTAEQAKAFLNYHTKQRFNKKPFMAVVGFRRPHLPNVVPENFKDLYPLDEIINPPEITRRPAHAPYEAGMVGGKYSLGEVSTYHDVKPRSRAFISEIKAKEQRGELTLADRSFNGNYVGNRTAARIKQGYYAGVSYVDSLVGDVLAELKKLKLDNNTIIVFTSDHGYHLGENALWGKFTLYETNLRVPLLIKIPGTTDPGVIVKEPVELLDILPTVTHQIGYVRYHKCVKRCEPHMYPCADGKTLLPLIRSKLAATTRPTVSPRTRAAEEPLDMGQEFQYLAYSQIFRRPMNMVVGFVKGMGYSVRSKNFRYSEWATCYRNDVDNLRVVAREFYDHRVDPYEMTNVVDTFQDQLYVRTMTDILEDFREDVTRTGDDLLYICENVRNIGSFKNRVNLPLPPSRPEEDVDTETEEEEPDEPSFWPKLPDIGDEDLEGYLQFLQEMREHEEEEEEGS